MSLGIILDPIQQTGLTVVAKVRNQSGAQVGVTTTLTEGDDGVYIGAFSLAAVPDGVYSVSFLDNVTGGLLGDGELVVKGAAEVDKTNLDAAVSSRATPASAADAVWDEAYSAHTTAGTYGKLLDNLRKANLAVDGAVAGTPTASAFDTDLSDPTGTHDHQLILFTSGALTGYSRPIATFTNGASNTITLTEALPSAPAPGDEFVILAQHVHPISDIQAGLATASSVALIETKAQADARQAILVAEHDATQAAIAGVSVPSASTIATAVWSAVSRSLTDKADFTLSSAYQATLVTAIEAALLNDGDGQALINAILQVINTNLDLPSLELQAIATQVRTELATELARMDATISSRASQTSVNTVDTVVDAIKLTVDTNLNATVSSRATQSSVDTVDTVVDAIKLTVDTNLNATVASRSTQASVDVVDGIVDNIYTNTQRVNSLIENVSGDRFTTKALEKAGTTATDIHTALDSYANKSAWKADVSGLATQLSVSNLHNLSTADIDARLAAYDAPTLAEMTAAFTQVKGSGWTVTDTLEAIRDAITAGALTAAQVWSHGTRTLTAGTKDAAIDAIKERTDNLPTRPASYRDLVALTQ